MPNDTKPKGMSLKELYSAYGVSWRTFCSWIEINKELQEVLQPYRQSKQYIFPPAVVSRVFDILGEPG